MFQDDEEQTVEESSDDNEEREESREEQEQERDNEEISMAELRRQGQVGEARGGELEGDTSEEEDEEIPNEKLERLNEAHSTELERRKEEERAQNLKLTQKCREHVSKIQASGSRGRAAPMSALLIKAN